MFNFVYKYREYVSNHKNHGAFMKKGFFGPLITNWQADQVNYIIKITFTIFTFPFPKIKKQWRETNKKEGGETIREGDLILGYNWKISRWTLFLESFL